MKIKKRTLKDFSLMHIQAKKSIAAVKYKLFPMHIDAIRNSWIRRLKTEFTDLKKDQWYIEKCIEDVERALEEKEMEMIRRSDRSFSRKLYRISEGTKILKSL